MNIPGVITAGDSLTWTDEVCIDPNSGDTLTPGTWTLRYAIRGAASLDVVSTPGGDGWLCTVTAAQTATLTAGTYSWQAFATTAAGQRVTVGYGDLTVKPNLAAVEGVYDGRSLAKQIIDAIEAEIQGRASGGYVTEYSIAGRSLRKEPLSELLKLKAAYQAQYAQELKKQRQEQGRGDPSASFALFRGPSLRGGW